MDVRDRILELYEKKPGLTCGAIARRVDAPEEFVRRCLGYSPAKSLDKYVEPAHWHLVRTR